ncbi:MAG TPA: HAD hydrolase-like protein [Dehalococcoidia bacterium]|nr:HAD hydrolase-like protein [Dehalococcoidia bacterium]
MARLYLFDIDNTLLNSGGAGAKAMTLAFEEIFGVPDAFAGIEYTGRSDIAIFHDAALAHSLDVNGPFPDLLDRFRESYFSFLPQTLRQNPGRVMPGMPEVLAALELTPGAHLGLATGNFSLSARLKLEYYGLQRFFQTGGFGEDSDERAEIVARAIERVAALAADAGPHSTFVIGDTPLDVAAALANGVVAVGVATGTFSVDALKEAGAGLVFPDFSHWQNVMAALLG